MIAGYFAHMIIIYNLAQNYKTMIRQKIETEMKAQKMNQTKLCGLTGITNAQMSNFLTEKKALSLSNIELILEALNIKLIKIL